VHTPTRTKTPTPHKGGDEGCTHHFWKKYENFDEWTAPYSPNTQFSAVFNNAFPGLTLLQVLHLDGSALNVLGRQTVAALLNAASPEVDYKYSTGEVISMFNGTYPGGSLEYWGLAVAFYLENTEGCPLSHK
jgi:hypothetical protein